jgi:hypothetical protein
MPKPGIFIKRKSSDETPSGLRSECAFKAEWRTESVNDMQAKFQKDAGRPIHDQWKSYPITNGRVTISIAKNVSSQ